MRELVTLVMLASLSYLAGRKFHVQLAYFLLAFAIRDIFYYVWLKVLLGWPATLLDWDVLFLIPIVWVGPVLAPILCSVVIDYFRFYPLAGPCGNPVKIQAR